VQRVSCVRQTVIDTIILSVPDPSPFEAKIPIAKLKCYKLPGIDLILTEVGGETLPSLSHKLINSILNCLITGRSLFLHQFQRTAIELTVVIIVGYHCYQLQTS
jgi:hypothetical protein